MSPDRGGGPKDVRILYQSFGPPANRAYLDSLRLTLDGTGRACRATVEIGTLRGTALAEKQHRAFHLAAGADLLVEIHAAAGRGYDAAVIGNIQDPALFESRQVSAIPIVGLLESVLSTTRPFGATVGLMTTGRLTIPLIRERILVYGERDRVSAIRSADVALPELLRSFTDRPLRRRILKSVREAAARVVEEGAEIVVAGSGMLAELLNAEARERGLDLGVSAPCLDPVQIAVSAAVAAARSAALGSVVARSGTYAAPTADALAAFFARPGPDRSPASDHVKGRSR